MYYGSTTKANDFTPLDWKGRVIRSLLWFVPSANPDFEHLFPFVRSWLVEVDEDGNVQREIALSENGLPLFAAPAARNCGFWTDSNKQFERAELGELSAAEFDAAWSSATMLNNALQAARENA
ncbi:hypothetical protein [Stutzerimonas nitrititolerans]|uniref:hypothetical protein n=1 Tax=Stutzerimonas nitrititolerans TaxID=2482751 RepID=UPI0028B12A2E|nr:hypothetical protein [Stutzerimonas nitrititolerans]